MTHFVTRATPFISMARAINWNNIIQLDLVNRKPQGHNGTINYKKTFYVVINQPFFAISSSAFVCTL